MSTKSESPREHEWVKNDPRWPSIRDIEFCAICTVGRRADGKNKPCRGYAPAISLRAIPIPSEALAGDPMRFLRGQPSPDTELSELVAAVEALPRYDSVDSAPGLFTHPYGRCIDRDDVLALLRARQEGR